MLPGADVRVSQSRGGNTRVRECSSCSCGTSAGWLGTLGVAGTHPLGSETCAKAVEPGQAVQPGRRFLLPSPLVAGRLQEAAEPWATSGGSPSARGIGAWQRVAEPRDGPRRVVPAGAVSPPSPVASPHRFPVSSSAAGAPRSGWAAGRAAGTGPGDSGRRGACGPRSPRALQPALRCCVRVRAARAAPVRVGFPPLLFAARRPRATLACVRQRPPPLPLLRLPGTDGWL